MLGQARDEQHGAGDPTGPWADAARDGVVALDRVGRVQHWSPAAARLYGWSADQLLGGPLPALTPAGWPDGVRALHTAALAGQPAGPLRTLALRADGGVVPVELAADPVLDAGGRVVGSCTVHRDRRAHGARLEAALAARGCGPDEAEIAALLLAGLRPGAIARCLYRSPGTIRNRLSAMYAKFEVCDQGALVLALHAALGTPLDAPGGPPAALIG